MSLLALWSVCLNKREQPIQEITQVQVLPAEGFARYCSPSANVLQIKRPASVYTWQVLAGLWALFQRFLTERDKDLTKY